MLHTCSIQTNTSEMCCVKSFVYIYC